MLSLCPLLLTFQYPNQSLRNLVYILAPESISAIWKTEINGRMDPLRSARRLLVTASVVPSSQILVILMEALRSSETSVLTRAAQHNIPEDGILHNHRRENLKSYIPEVCFSFLL
jgi:hypothetical protein